jgi:hypothetical protein
MEDKILKWNDLINKYFLLEEECMIALLKFKILNKLYIFSRKIESLYVFYIW